MTSALRWRIAILIGAAIAISYLDRQALPVAVKAITNSIPLTNEQFYELQSAFLFTYAFIYAGGGNRRRSRVAPPLIALIISSLNWRGVFLVTGATGLLWTVWWTLSYVSVPADPEWHDSGENVLRARSESDASGQNIRRGARGV